MAAALVNLEHLALLENVKALLKITRKSELQFIRIPLGPESVFICHPVRAEMLRENVGRLESVNQDHGSVNIHVVNGWGNKEYIDAFEIEMFFCKNGIPRFEEPLSLEVENIPAIVRNGIDEIRFARKHSEILIAVDGMNGFNEDAFYLERPAGLRDNYPLLWNLHFQSFLQTGLG